MNATDQVIKQYREQISDTDRKILDALNQRIKLVEKLKQYKAGQGIGFLDPAQEDWVLTFLTRSNRGPLSDDGLRTIYKVILDVVKGEVGERAQS